MDALTSWINQFLRHWRGLGTATTAPAAPSGAAQQAAERGRALAQQLL